MDFELDIVRRDGIDESSRLCFGRRSVPLELHCMPTTVCTAKASYKKTPGQLELTETHLQWFADGKKAPSVRVLYAEAAC